MWSILRLLDLPTLKGKYMAFKTTLFAAATASHLVQLDARDVLRPVQIRNGEICCSRGQDDDWIVLDQEIDIDDAGTAQVDVRSAWGGGIETLKMCFMTARPLAADDLAKVEVRP